MQTFVPKYYFDFKCISDKCKHNCCIGWEIDIDDDTYRKYCDVGGDIGERLARNIEAEGEPHFKLGDDERCPFLNEKNLCDIITELSEASLCQVCKDHPRFRNYFDEHIEMGLGITCEEVARIVLKTAEKDAVSFVCLNDPSVDYLSAVPMFPERYTVFDVLQDPDMKLSDKIHATLAICSGELPNKTVAEWVDIFNELELLDENWQRELNLLRDSVINDDMSLFCYAESVLNQKELSIPLTRLLTYFIYRHLADGLEDDALGARAAFCVTSALIIAAIFKVHLENTGELSEEQIVDIVRMYSSEIEYSNENLDKLIDICK